MQKVKVARMGRTVFYGGGCVGVSEREVVSEKRASAVCPDTSRSAVYQRVDGGDGRTGRRGAPSSCYFSLLLNLPSRNMGAL